VSITITYQCDRDRFELSTPRTVYVLSPEEVEELAYDLESSVNERMRFKFQQAEDGAE